MSKIVARAARLADIPAMVELAVESVSRDPLPVTVCRATMAETLRASVGNPQHFAWVTERDGAVIGAVVAQTFRGFWFMRRQCSVLMYFTREGGGCMPLLRELARWIKARPAIKLAVLELEPGADPRLISALHRLGFARQSTNVAYVRQA
jgi:hypothetical protein